MRKIWMFFLLIPGFSLAQSSIKNFTTGLVFAPEVSFLNDKSESTNSSGYAYQYEFSHNAGLDVVMGFTEKLKLSVGIFGGARNFERTDYCYVCDVEYTPVSNIKMKYLNIPVNGWFYAAEGRFDLYGIAGFTNTLRLKVKEYRTSYSGRIDEFDAKEKYNKLTIGLNAGVGLNYNVSYRLSIALNSIYCHGVGLFGTDPKLAYRGLYLQTGLYYRF